MPAWIEEGINSSFAAWARQVPPGNKDDLAFLQEGLGLAVGPRRTRVLPHSLSVFLYGVCLEKEEGGSFGIAFDHVTDGAPVQVLVAVKDDSPAAEWNRVAKRGVRVLQPGDRIVRANGVDSSGEAIKEAIVSSLAVDLILARYPDEFTLSWARRGTGDHTGLILHHEEEAPQWHSLLRATPSKERRVLIDRVEPGSVIACWNTSVAEQGGYHLMPQPGHEVVEINGIRGDLDMMTREAQEARHVRVVFCRRRSAASMDISWKGAHEQNFTWSRLRAMEFPKVPGTAAPTLHDDATEPDDTATQTAQGMAGGSATSDVPAPVAWAGSFLAAKESVAKLVAAARADGGTEAQRPDGPPAPSSVASTPRDGVASTPRGSVNLVTPRAPLLGTSMKGGFAAAREAVAELVAAARQKDEAAAKQSDALL